MSTPHTMAQAAAQSSLQQHRSQFSPPPNGQRDYAMPNGRTNSFGPSTSPVPMTFSSPTPQQQQPPSQFGHVPPQKRLRLSPDVSSPFQQSTTYPQNGTPQAASPGPHVSFSVASSQNSRPGLMAPPQRPPEKSTEDRSYDDVLAGTGINIEEEERNLNRPEYLGQASSSFQNSGGSFSSYQTASFGQANGVASSSFGSSDGTQLSIGEKTKREHERADWEAARHSQHALWDMFLYGGTLNEKIKQFSGAEHLVEAQAGVLVNTQKNAPPPTVRVNGLEGASKVIDQGQSILDTKDKAERLSDIMKLVSLAAKSRLIGLLKSSARLSIERRQHAQGKIPDDWKDIAVASNVSEDKALEVASPSGSTALKRTHSQANSTSEQQSVHHPAIDVFEKSTVGSRSAEEVRLARRQKRKNKATEDKEGADLESADAALAALDADKKTTKKERKATESKFAEQQQHKNANEAARLATSSIIGRTFGKKGKSYSWMTGGAGGGASTVSTPGRGIGSSTGTPGTATPGVSRAPAIPRGRRFQDWDENIDKGVTVRDILLVLEQDPQATKAYIRGCSAIDGKET